MVNAWMNANKLYSQRKACSDDYYNNNNENDDDDSDGEHNYFVSLLITQEMLWFSWIKYTFYFLAAKLRSHDFKKRDKIVFVGLQIESIVQNLQE